MPERDRLHDHVPAGAALRPASAEELVRIQNTLAQASSTPWRTGGGPLAVGGCFVVFQRGSQEPALRATLPLPVRPPFVSVSSRAPL